MAAESTPSQYFFLSMPVMPVQYKCIQRCRIQTILNSTTMQFSISILVGLLWLGQTSAFVVEARDSLEARQAATTACTDTNLAFAFLRGYNSVTGKHLYTTSFGEMVTALQHSGYAFESTSAFVFHPQIPSTSTVPFFRLYNPTSGDHFFTTSESEVESAISNSGYTFQNIAASVYPTKICNSTSLFRLYNSFSGDHFYTTSATERDTAIAISGYTSEGTAAFVLQPCSKLSLVAGTNISD
ncbi:hypothetical protein BD410DRAFT_796054 [Rickenella mellea]|uniref:DUF5648 domain-containing protein n=1 Tax=Rickenella mellea TaxID=50990 RepID=A0A4Y7PMT8_9AGAM|nr:hypothetical protein BD410DRAFT_796054 [Rickenella mellea]